MKLLKVVCTILIICTACACTKERVYYASKPIQNVWEKRDTLVLQLHLTDSLADSTQVALLVRNKIDYPFLNFVAEVICNMPDSTRWNSQKVSIKLADEQGSWLGKGWSNMFQSTGTVANFANVAPGVYTFKITQQMDNEPLKGVHDVGIMVSKRKHTGTD